MPEPTERDLEVTDEELEEEAVDYGQPQDPGVLYTDKAQDPEAVEE